MAGLNHNRRRRERARKARRVPGKSNSKYRGSKSLAYDLIRERSAVSRRVVLLLRSTEAQLLFRRFVDDEFILIFF